MAIDLHIYVPLIAKARKVYLDGLVEWNQENEISMYYYTCIGSDVLVVELVELGIFGNREAPTLPLELAKITQDYLEPSDLVTLMSDGDEEVWECINYGCEE